MSATLGLCEVCAYADALGPEKAAQQVALADAEKAKRRRPKATKGSS